MSESIHQEIEVDAAPERVYAVLTTAAEFSQMTGGAPAEIDSSPGGEFSCFGGMIHGRTVEASPGEWLVQAWRVKSWDPGVYSLVRFQILSDGDRSRVVLDHSGFPQGQGKHLDQGWHTNYWEPLKAALA